MRFTSLSLVALLAVVAHGCGLKGPLYLPEPAKEVPAEPESEQQKKKSEQPAAPAPTEDQQ
jgi:predicted small lipoprotein YifL